MSKRWIWIIVTIVVAALAVVCILSVQNEQKHPKKSQTEALLGGEHQLRKMVERTETNSSTSASFFLIVGSLDSQVSTSVNLKFSWEMNDGTYAISSLPMEKFRIKIDESATTPTIKFRWRPFVNGGTPQVQDLMDNNVLYALLTVRESDWPVKVDLPLN
jgi:hypothetical protein